MDKTLEQFVEQEMKRADELEQAIKQEVEQILLPIIEEYAAKWDGTDVTSKEYCIKLLKTSRISPHYEPYKSVCLFCCVPTHSVIRTHGWSFSCCHSCQDRILKEMS